MILLASCPVDYYSGMEVSNIYFLERQRDDLEFACFISCFEDKLHGAYMLEGLFVSVGVRVGVER